MMSSTLNSVPSLKFLSSSPPPLATNCQDHDEDFQEFASFSHTNNSDLPTRINGDEFCYHTHASAESEACESPKVESISNAADTEDGVSANHDDAALTNKNLDTSVDSSPEHALMVSPPPLDCVLSSSFDNLDIVSPSHHQYILEDDEDFGDFVSTDNINSDDITEIKSKAVESSEIDGSLPLSEDSSCFVNPEVVLSSDSIVITCDDNQICESKPNSNFCTYNVEGLSNPHLISSQTTCDSSEVNLPPSIESLVEVLPSIETHEISHSSESLTNPENCACITNITENTSPTCNISEDCESSEACRESSDSFECQENEQDEFGEFSDFNHALCGENEVSDDFGDFNNFQEVTPHKSNDSSIPKEQNVESDCDIDKIRNLDWLDEDEDSDEFCNFETGLPQADSVNVGQDSFYARKPTNKFEELFLRWLPNDKQEPTTEDISMKLSEVVDGDAFVWHHLEDIDSCVALNLSWQSCHVHKYFLGSVDVDARNILFGQKFSSSIPVFAQTLSFSPLTPARYSESSSVSWSDPSPELQLPPTSEERAAAAQSSPKESERVIPPAQFDWSSSGLTNPLEVPGLEREILQAPPTPPKGESGSLSKDVSPLGTTQLMEKILNDKCQKKSPPPYETPFHSLNEDVKEIIKGIPSLSFMKEKVLMFPIRSDAANS